MSDYVHIKSDAHDAYQHFLKVNFEVMSTAVKKAVRAGLAAVQKDVKSNLSSTLRNTNKRGARWSGGKKITFGDTLQQGVRIGKIRIDNEDDTVSGSVLITSTRKKDSGSYRLHILENGSFRTGERFTKYYTDRHGVQHKLKKPRSTGVLEAYHFFKPAVSSSKFSSVVQNYLTKYIQQAQ